MKKTLIGLALALCLSLGAGSAPLARAQAPGQGTRPADDPFARFVFPPELVMAHQQKLNLSDRARAAIQDAIKEAQGKFVDAQWRLSGEGEKLQKLLQATTVDEAKVLEQIDRTTFTALVLNPFLSEEDLLKRILLEQTRQCPRSYV